MMKKLLTIILTLIASTSIVSASTNLWEFYNEQGEQLPSFEFRKDFYEQILDEDEYKGTAKQNDLYLKYLQENYIIPAPKANEIKLGAFNPAGGTTYRLQASIGTTDATIKLSSFKNRSSIPLTMTLLATDIGYGTLSPQTTRSEFVSFSGITQNADGTATLTGVSRGLSDISPFTASTTLRQAHPGQSVFILSDSPQLFEEYAKRRTDISISGLWTFTNNPVSTAGNATSSTQLTTKSYVDNVANAGAATSTETNGGLVELGTLAEQADSFDGGANKPTVLQTKNSTSTCQVVGSYNIVASSTTGKLDKNCLDQSLSYVFSGANTHSGLNTFTNATTSIEGRLGVGTSSPFTSLGVAGTITTNNINATTTTATSTFSGNVVVSNNASTTNLTISRTCVGCLSGYERITATASLTTSDNGDTSTTASCSAGKNVVGGGYDTAGDAYNAKNSYPSSNTAWTASVRCESTGLGTCNAGNLTVYAICVNP